MPMRWLNNYKTRIMRLSNGNAIEVGTEGRNKVDALKQFADKAVYVEDKIAEIAEGAHVTDVTIEEDKGQSEAINQARLINPNLQ